MGLTDELVPVLKKLRLSGVLQSLEVRVRQAVDEQLSHEEFLVQLLSDEVDRRDGRQFDQRVRRAGFDSLKTLEDFDFQFNPRAPKAKVIDLATCSFVERRQNVLLVGQAGVGKSHIAQALGHRACRAGYQVLYVGAGDMLKQLRAGRADGSYDRRLARLVGVDLLVVDDLGLRSLTVEEAVDVYEVIRLRYQRGAMILTSNRAVEEFGGLFGDPLLASAAMDRLLHDAHVLVLEGDSYRNPPPGR
ncbi:MULTISPECIES: IS21-like element helper ATPase IstB [Sorangium]|uniref:ATPase AAA n=1 Tax=Sorangium cellulosum TaxID=56 RepID=A0A4P2R277_SORCE|nr:MULTISPECIES: IS21-like element helper ATPase IstB [Sorangium]AUX37087.1 ATPase AAA [Sorangium cellulosum]WCQ96378.1 IS21 family transposase ISCsa9 [Sorangium sp. Soce836]